MLFLQECCKRQSVSGKRPLLTLNARNRQSDAASCAASSRVWPARTLRVLVQHRRHHPAAAEVTQLLRASAAWCTACHAHATLPPLPPRLHARGLSPLAAWRASQETPRLIGQGDGVQAAEAGSSPCGSAGSCTWSSTPVLATLPRASQRLGSEGHPRPQAAAPTHHRRRLSKLFCGCRAPRPWAGHCLPFAQILKYGYKKSLIRTKEGEVKWVPTKKLPSSSFASSACVVL